MIFFGGWILSVASRPGLDEMTPRSSVRGVLVSLSLSWMSSPS